MINMWILDMGAYCFNDLATYPPQFRNHIKSFMSATDPQRGGVWSARTANLYMTGLLRDAEQWTKHVATAECSAYSALAIAEVIHDCIQHCAGYPNTRLLFRDGGKPSHTPGYVERH